MTLSSVKGQERAVGAIKAALERQQLHHAWLFQGPEGVGKERAAVGLAQALVCTAKPLVGCGECEACVRVEHRNHPDVTWLMPEVEQIARGVSGRSDFTNAPSRDIRIDQVRKLQERLAFRALEARFKVCLVIEAHALNLNAQNALLKTLEEPPKDTVLVLISSAPDKLLPTIRSRCAKVDFSPLSTALLTELLLERATKKQPLSEADATQLAQMAGGSMARAVTMDPKAFAHRKEIIERFEQLKPDDASAWLLLAESLAEDRGSAETAIDVLRVWFRDVSLAQLGVMTLSNVDLASLAVEAGKRVSPAGVQRRLVLLDEAKNAITQRNGATRVQLERMFIEMFA